MYLILFPIFLIGSIQAKPVDERSLPHSRDYYAGYIKALTDNFEQLFEGNTRGVRSADETVEDKTDEALIRRSVKNQLESAQDIQHYKETQPDVVKELKRSVEKRDAKENEEKKFNVQDQGNEDYDEEDPVKKTDLPEDKISDNVDDREEASEEDDEEDVEQDNEASEAAQKRQYVLEHANGKGFPFMPNILSGYSDNRAAMLGMGAFGAGMFRQFPLGGAYSHGIPYGMAYAIPIPVMVDSSSYQKGEARSKIKDKKAKHKKRMIIRGLGPCGVVDPCLETGNRCVDGTNINGNTNDCFSNGYGANTFTTNGVSGSNPCSSTGNSGVGSTLQHIAGGPVQHIRLNDDRITINGVDAGNGCSGYGSNNNGGCNCNNGVNNNNNGINNNNGCNNGGRGSNGCVLSPCTAVDGNGNPLKTNTGVTTGCGTTGGGTTGGVDSGVTGSGATPNLKVHHVHHVNHHHIHHTGSPLAPGSDINSNGINPNSASCGNGGNGGATLPGNNGCNGINGGTCGGTNGCNGGTNGCNSGTNGCNGGANGLNACGNDGNNGCNGYNGNNGCNGNGNVRCNGNGLNNRCDNGGVIVG